MFVADDMAIALGISALMGGAGAGLSAFGSKKNKGGTPPSASWIPAEEYPIWRDKIMPQYGEYLSQGLQSLQEGRTPNWFSMYRGAEEPAMRRDLYRTYYGGPDAFGPGILETQQATDIAAGRRGGAASTNYARQLADYATKSMQIDEYMTKLGAGAMQEAEGRYLTQMGQFPRGPQQQYQFMEGTEYQPNWMETLGTGMAGMAPWVSSMYQPKTATTPYGTSFGMSYSGNRTGNLGMPNYAAQIGALKW